MSSPFTLFEISWETCNKVGGIHTVLSTKAKTMVDRLGDDYVTIGPWLLSDSDCPKCFHEEPAYQTFADDCRAAGLPVKVGRWDIPGSPLSLLVEFSGLYDEKDNILAELWEDFGVDSLSGDWDYVEPVLFGVAAGRVLERWWDTFIDQKHRRAVIHAHEWMTGSALLYLKRRLPAVGTVFTTHATMLGRALSSMGQSPDDGLGDRTPADLAVEQGVVAKHSLEGTLIREADVFTTVSEVTAREAELLHGRRPKPITHNGLDLEVVDVLAGSTPRDEARTALTQMASSFFGEDVSDAAYLAISGRYEFHNKGIDLLLDAAARLNQREGRRVVLFLLVPAGNSGIRSQLLERRELSPEQLDGPMGLSTHNLFEEGKDPIQEHCARLGLSNSRESRVKIMHVPIYMSAGDGFLDLPYEGVLRAMDLTCFPSYYEPWGYTPQESLAVGVPTITSDYAGFGRWAREMNLGPADGITVLERVRRRHDEAVEGLDGILEGFLREGRSARELEGICRATAAKSSWSQFIGRYESAYQSANDAVQRRLEAGVAQARRPKKTLVVQPRPEAQRPRLLSFDVSATVPDTLAGLHRLARNLWWSWDPEAPELFRELSPTAWEANHHNPISFLQRIYPEDLAAKGADPEYVARLGRVLARFEAYLAEPQAKARWRAETACAATLTPEHPIAYFCAEYGMHESVRIYSGGLGILAGDHLKSASDLNLPLVAVGLYYSMGYMGQALSSAGEQINLDIPNDPLHLPMEPIRGEDGAPLELSLPLPGRELSLRAWRVSVGRISLYLLDADTPSNRPEDRNITRNLYGGDSETRLQQEIVLGRGGVRLLRHLGIAPAAYHMNEGHAAFLTLERVTHLVRKEGLTFSEAREFVRATTLFTTHTPVPAGHDRFGEDMMRRYFSDAAEWVGVPWDRFLALGQAEGDRETFNMTYLALSFASYRNGVSSLHGEVSRELLRPFWPRLLQGEVPIDSITNGVHLATWTHPDIARAMGVEGRPVLGKDFSGATPEAMGSLWAAKRRLKRAFLAEVHRRLESSFLDRADSPRILDGMLDGLDEEALLIGFARRFAPYKRADLMFRDVERLAALLDSTDRPLRIFVAGKAHPRDQHGQDILKGIVERTRNADFRGKIFFLEDYDIDLARYLLQGVDVWLNNPTRLLEASGTSGMKAAANGTLNLSIGDGWWPEAFDGENGWMLGGQRGYENQDLQNELDAATLYRLLEEEVLPDYFERDAEGLPTRWLERMRRCLLTVPPAFSSDRMVLDYTQRAYAPLSGAHAELSQNRKWKLKSLVSEHKRLSEGFGLLRIVSAEVGDLRDLRVGDAVEVKVEVDLGPLSPEDVAVELVLGHSRGEADLAKRNVVALAYVQTTRDSNHVFEGVQPLARSGRFSYGVRVRARSRQEDRGALDDLVVWA